MWGHLKLPRILPGKATQLGSWPHLMDLILQLLRCLLGLCGRREKGEEGRSWLSSQGARLRPAPGAWSRPE